MAFQRASRGILLAREGVSSLSISLKAFAEIWRLQSHDNEDVGCHFWCSFRVPVRCQHFVLVDPTRNLAFYAFFEEA